jgi:predicted lipoprotein with Yx(FWY)xxD motif
MRSLAFSRRTAAAGAVLAASLLAIAACASSGSKAPASASVAAQSAPASTAPATTAPPTTATTSPTLAVGTTKLGPVVVDRSGRTTYVFDKDTPGTTTSACTAACASLWPAVTATGAPTAAAGVSGTVGVITRPDGTRQVTLDGRPLYVFKGDQAAGDAHGDGIAGLWHAARPTGTSAAGTATTTPTTAPAVAPAVAQHQAPAATAPPAPPTTAPARTVPPTAPPPTAPPTTRPVPPTYPPTTGGGGGYGY